MRRTTVYLSLCFIVFVLLIGGSRSTKFIHAQDATGEATMAPTTEPVANCSDFLTVEAVFGRVKPTSDQLAELKRTYDQQWQLCELSTWPDEQLEVAAKIAYDFYAARSGAHLQAIKQVTETYLLSIGIQKALIQPNEGVSYFKGYADIEDALRDGRLEKIKEGTFKLRPGVPFLQTNPETATAVYEFQKFLGDKSSLLWGVSSARSAAEQEALRKLAYPAIPLAWGLSPHLLGNAITLAITDYVGSGGVYDRFLKGLDQKALDAARKCVIEGQKQGSTPCFPTWGKLIELGVITDQEFIDLYEALSNNPYFDFYDLTGSYSILTSEDGKYELGSLNADAPINPSFLLVRKTTL